MIVRGETGAAFKEAYASLNAAQKEAVDTIEGPVMVIAGPGTGKTQILTLRIAKILLETDMQPDNVLALTFTEAGAKAMRERLRSYIGSAAYQVSIYTFHGFAERLIRDYPDAYQKVIGGRPASELDKVTIVESILADTQFKLLRPLGNPLYYVPSVIRTIAQLKQEYITPDGFNEILKRQEQDLNNTEKIHQKGAHKGRVRSEYTTKEKQLAKNRELQTAYRLYEAALQEQRRYDFEDMLVETIEALVSNEDMLRDLQEQYQYVLADEHQDVNGSQNKILELLSSFHTSPNIFVVGDEKQAIYRFQGASLENFLYFTDVFKDTRQIDLIQNYRSGQPILDVAHSLVAVEEGPLKDLRVELKAESKIEVSLERREFSHQAVEDQWVCDQIAEELERGTASEEIAVIVRTNREVEQLTTKLRKAGISVTASADSDILEHPITHTIQCFIKAITNPGDESALFGLLHNPCWGISANDLVRLTRARSYDRPLSTIIAEPETFQSVGISDEDAVVKVHLTLERARALNTTQVPHRVLEFVLQESGYLEYIMRTDPLESGRVVRRLYDEVEQLVMSEGAVTLAALSQVLENYRQHRLPLMAPFIASTEAAVSVMTAHKSKGLEFDTVIIPHLVDSLWGGSNRRSDFRIPITRFINEAEFDRLDDEQRLLYVAITRARQRLYVSNSQANSEGKELIASRLLTAIDETLLPVLPTKSQEVSFNPLSQLTQRTPVAAIDPELLKTHLEQRGLSATALNNYLRSPYDYLYRNVLRVPEVQALPLLYGTAVHEVMEWVSAKFAKTSAIPSPTELAHKLETELGRLPIARSEFVRLHEKGLETLTVYLEHTQSTLTKDARVEFNINVSLPTGLPVFPELTLTGKLDRLDFDKEGNVLRVIDYKTGKPRSRNDIEGKTKTSTGDYKRQLIFYALMLSLYDDERYHCRTGVLSFIEPTAKGEVREEIFEITDAEMAELKQELIRIAQEISSGAFLTVPCDPTTSNYCSLAETLLER